MLPHIGYDARHRALCSQANYLQNHPLCSLTYISQPALNLSDLIIDSISITSRGNNPANPKFAYKGHCLAEGLVTEAGTDLLINIGNLTGAVKHPEIDRSKPRQIDIVTDDPFNHRFNLTITIPEGYTVDPASLESPQANKSNVTGSYFAQTTYNPDDNTLKIVTNYRNNRRYLPMRCWDDFLDIHDAAAAFADATLVLIPKD